MVVRVRPARVSFQHRGRTSERQSEGQRHANQGSERGRFGVEIEVANYWELTLVDRGFLEADQVRRQKIQGVVVTEFAKDYQTRSWKPIPLPK